MKRLLLVVGARPNFMKMSPLYRELLKFPDHFEPLIVHTGQHYDYVMSRAFFDDFELPEPHYYLGVGSDTHARQTAKIMVELESVIEKTSPDLVVVFGDVNSTLAAAVVTSKLQVPLAHVEAGLRSFDRTMPEEINRMVTDILSDFLFTTEESANKNLLREGIMEEKIYFVGNIMIDTLLLYIDKAEETKIMDSLNLKSGGFALLTLHRPSNVDRKEKLQEIMDAILEISNKIPVIFPIHPRTKKNLERFGLYGKYEKGIRLISPLKYTDFLKLEKEALFVMTDSGGIQEETTFLGIPCITIRENTERPVTVDIGTNILAGTDGERILEEANKILNGERKKGKIPPLWDGKTAQRIAGILKEGL